MANLAVIKGKLSILGTAVASPIADAFTYLCSAIQVGTIQPGVPLPTRGGNLRWFPVQVTTSASANAEVTVPHGLGPQQVPYALICQAARLDVAGGRVGIPLTVTRPADTVNIYVSSPTTNATITIMVEA